MDVLGYDGQARHRHRCGLGHGRGDGALLVELGAEVHAIDIKKPEIAGPRELHASAICAIPTQIEATVDKIGSVVNMLFNCAGCRTRSPTST